MEYGGEVSLKIDRIGKNIASVEAMVFSGIGGFSLGTSIPEWLGVGVFGIAAAVFFFGLAFFTEEEK